MQDSTRLEIDLPSPGASCRILLQPGGVISGEWFTARRQVFFLSDLF